MCGIAGVHDLDGLGAGGADLVRRMCATMHDRGPDGAGSFQFPRSDPVVCLGVRRLATLDPAGGDQPLATADGEVTLVFNGFIANHRRLRARLAARGHQLRTGNDGEVLVHLYRELGLDLLTEISGMFAFALWDAPRHRLVLAVDPIGIKPLYVAEHGGRLLFASRATALRLDRELPWRLAPTAVDTFLTFGYPIGDETLVAGVRRLPPGHLLVREDGVTTVRAYDPPRPPPDAPRPRQRSVAVAEVRDRLTATVRDHLDSDVPLGLFLSGGLDSAALLATVRRVTGNVMPTFTVGYATSAGMPPAADETAAAARLARHFGAENHQLRLDARRWWDEIEPYVAAVDEPVANSSMVSLMALARLAAGQVTVALNGTGGDELFAGYPGHRTHPWLLRSATAAEHLLPGPVRRALAGPGWRRLEAWLPYLRRRRFFGALPPHIAELRAAILPRSEALRRLVSFDGWTFSDSLRSELLSPELAAACDHGRSHDRTFDRLLAPLAEHAPGDLVHALTFRTWLPGNGLLALDAVTMAHGLETRVPYFERDMLDCASRLPHRLRSRPPKGVLREAVADDLPDWARRRPKQPFETPIGPWFDHELAEPLRQVVLDPRSLGRGLLRPQAVERLLDRHHRRRADHAELILRLALLELWQRRVLDAPPDDPVSFGNGRP